MNAGIVIKKIVNNKLKNIKAAGDKYIRGLKWSKADTAKWMNTKLPILPTVGRQLLPYAKGLGWAGAITTGVSLLAQTKRAKKYRADLQGTRPQKIKHFPAQRKVRN